MTREFIVPDDRSGLVRDREKVLELFRAFSDAEDSLLEIASQYACDLRVNNSPDFITAVEEEGVTYQYESFWSYGGYEQGTETVPMEYILNPKAYVDAKNAELRRNIRRANKRDAEAKKAADLKKLAELKERYPDA